MKVLLPLLQEYLTCHHQTPDPACRSRQTSLSQVLVDQERHIPLQESFVTAVSQSTWQPQVRYPEGTMPHTSHRDLNACPSLSCTLRLEPIPICPSLCSGTDPAVETGTRSVFSPSHSAQGYGHSGHPDPWGLNTRRCLSTRGAALPRAPPDGPGTRHAPCFVTRTDCRD